jgi:hypothetical protein
MSAVSGASFRRTSVLRWPFSDHRLTLVPPTPIREPTARHSGHSNPTSPLMHDRLEPAQLNLRKATGYEGENPGRLNSTGANSDWEEFTWLRDAILKGVGR